MSNLKKIFKKILRLKKEKIIIPVYTPVAPSQILHNKIVMITGGTGGIGFAIAKESIKCGAKVILCGTNTKKLSEFSAELGEKSRSLVLDLYDYASIPDSVAKGLSLFPESRIDILINAAGFHGDWDFFHFDENLFDKTMGINLKGTYYISQIVAQSMVQKKIKGHILFLSSSSSLRPAWTPYQISKWAVTGMTKGFADYLLPHGIIVNAIAPGPTATAMVKKDDDNLFYFNQPAQRYSTPEEIANLAIFMVSPLGDMIVGDTYYISGGSGVISYHK